MAPAPVQKRSDAASRPQDDLAGLGTWQRSGAPKLSPAERVARLARRRAANTAYQRMRRRFIRARERRLGRMACLCPACGETFTRGRVDQRYCSGKCRTRACRGNASAYAQRVPNSAEAQP
jgi:hypothetical protein